MRSVIRGSSFVRKELIAIFRQPQLAATIILGPFVLLLLFGIGYRAEARDLRTLFVVSDVSPLRSKVEEYATSLGPQLIFAGVTGDSSKAMDRLRNGAVDLVVVIPNDVYGTVRRGHRALIRLYHNELDPMQAQYVAGFGEVYVGEVNRRVLFLVVESAQDEITGLYAAIGEALQEGTALREALQQGSRLQAYERLLALEERMDALVAALDVELGILQALGEIAGDGSEGAQEILGLVADIRALSEWLDRVNAQVDAVTVEEVLRLERELARFRSVLGQFSGVDPAVLVKLFETETRSIAPTQVDTQDFYTPSVIVVLLQHLCVTLGGLSIVSEHGSGAFELFQVSPLSAIEVLVGKYASYLLAAGIVAVLLTGVVTWGLGVPIVGAVAHYAATVLLLVLASLGLGFIISLLSRTTSQVVQYAMITLLASVFFSGFFLGLEMLWKPIRVLSWFLPATFAIRALRTVMLRGQSPETLSMAALTAMALLSFAGAWLLLRKSLARS
jgi:ABC-2 type transport system permease protein